MCGDTRTYIHTLAQTISAKSLYILSYPTHIFLLYVYISLLSDGAAQMPTWGVFRVAGLGLNWLCLWVCISLDPSSGSNPFRLMMMRFIFFVWTEVVRVQGKKNVQS